MSQIVISPSVAESHAALLSSLLAVGRQAQIAPVAAVAEGSFALIGPGDVVPVGGTAVVVEATDGAPRLALGKPHIAVAFGPADAAFGHALVAELTRPAHAIAAADPASLELLVLATRVAASDVTVLINGPTGTGKEVLARFIHKESARREGPLVAINCAALPESMLEAILFGHERGSFTGAAQASKGLIRAADGGTLLLDEIAEMPLALQAKLLRVLQEREVMPIGAISPQPVDVRIIAAANRDLRRESEAGNFRSDLYYRLNVFPLQTQPLCRRPRDLTAITAALLLRHGADRPFAWPTPEALAKLAGHRWPGNVRELENVIQRALVLADGPCIEAAHILFDGAAEQDQAPRVTIVDEGRTLEEIVRDREFEAIQATLDACGGRRSEAASRLGISERTLRYKLAEMARSLSAEPVRMVI